MRPISEKILVNCLQPVSLISWVNYQYLSRLGKGQDSVLVTLPSAGTHWLRTMIAKVMVEHFNLDEDIQSITQDDLIPTYFSKRSRFKYNSDSNIPRVQHSHSSYSVALRRKRILLLVRDLRSTLISHYRVLQGNNKLNVTFSEFLRGEGYDTQRHHTLNSRINFLNSWHENQTKFSEFRILKYEDLKAQTFENLKSSIEFLFADKTLTEDEFLAAIEFGSMDNMKKIEINNPLQKYQKGITKVSGRMDVDFSSFFLPEDQVYFSEVVSRNLTENFDYDYTYWN